MGQTIVEKIFSRHVGRSCASGEFVVCQPDVLMTHDANRPVVADLLGQMGAQNLFDPQRFMVVIDHHTPAPAETNANIHQSLREFAAQRGTLFFESEGICHQLLTEKGLVVPGDLVIGSDSHTCTQGALNALACGVGSTDLAVALTRGMLWFKVPPSDKIDLAGRLAPNVFGKDLILHMIGKFSARSAVYACLEYSGTAVSFLSMAARLTICNMAVEMGAKASIMPCDDVLKAYLEDRARRPIRAVAPDSDAVYRTVRRIDLDQLEPLVARPHNVDDVVPVAAVEEVPVHQANLAGCVGNRLEDLAVAARILKGRKVHPGVRLLVTPPSREVLQDALAAGIIETLVAAGAVLANPSCKGCSGGARFGVPSDGENVISSASRNFQGRLGNPRANIYLASPATVAASALTGRITDCGQFL